MAQPRSVSVRFRNCGLPGRRPHTTPATASFDKRSESHDAIPKGYQSAGDFRGFEDQAFCGHDPRVLRPDPPLARLPSGEDGDRLPLRRGDRDAGLGVSGPPLYAQRPVGHARRPARTLHQGNADPGRAGREGDDLPSSRSGRPREGGEKSGLRGRPRGPDGLGAPERPPGRTRPRSPTPMRPECLTFRAGGWSF